MLHSVHILTIGRNSQHKNGLIYHAGPFPRGPLNPSTIATSPAHIFKVYQSARPLAHKTHCGRRLPGTCTPRIQRNWGGGRGFSMVNQVAASIRNTSVAQVWMYPCSHGDGGHRHLTTKSSFTPCYWMGHTVTTAPVAT